MNEPDISLVERRLAEVLKKERREAISYTVLTVLCTPVFVVMASLVGMVILLFVLRGADYDINALGIYAGINIFLALMLVFVLMRSNPPEQPHEFDKMWLAGLIAFLSLLVLTYLTSIPERFPLFFGIIYTVLGFVVLGLLGQVWINNPATDDAKGEKVFLSFLLSIAAFIAMTYGEIAHCSWLWIPPKPDEVRLAAWMLCKLAVKKPMPLETRIAPIHIQNLLSRLKLIQMNEDEIRLTQKGSDLIMTDSRIEYET